MITNLFFSLYSYIISIVFLNYDASTRKLIIETSLTSQLYVYLSIDLFELADVPALVPADVALELLCLE